MAGGSPPLLASDSSGEVTGSEPQRGFSCGGVVGDGGEGMKEKAPEKGGLFF